MNKITTTCVSLALATYVLTGCRGGNKGIEVAQQNNSRPGAHGRGLDAQAQQQAAEKAFADMENKWIHYPVYVKAVTGRTNGKFVMNITLGERNSDPNSGTDNVHATLEMDNAGATELKVGNKVINSMALSEIFTETKALDDVIDERFGTQSTNFDGAISNRDISGKISRTVNGQIYTKNFASRVRGRSFKEVLQKAMLEVAVRAEAPSRGKSTK